VAQKKRDNLPDLKQTLVKPIPGDESSRELELDELWSFVLTKAKKRWIWIALSRRTRQVVAFAIGDRSTATCRKLWDAIPHGYRTGHCSTDFWEAYSNVLPKRRHTAVGKDTGETAHVERWNNTLRQRLARFVRKTLSFSKSDAMHEICLAFFIHHYNGERALSFL
jgi:insertion element IS1 protein InsB